MAEHSIPVDLLNPGQVFGCLGLVEAADVLLGGAEGGFDWSDPNDVRFMVRATGKDNPVATVLDFLVRAEVATVAPMGSSNNTSKWRVPTTTLSAGEPFPFPDPASPATLPAILSAGGVSMAIDYWGDATRRDNVKFWAGAGGYPGAGLAIDALKLLRDEIAGDEAMDGALDDPFALARPQSSSFRFDWRRDYIPMEVGFSPNDHGEIVMVGYPLVELLAAIGLTHARPSRVSKLEYRYGAISDKGGEAFLDPAFLRAALGCSPLPFPQRTFFMQLGWPGQEGQARCIIDVREEPRP